MSEAVRFLEDAACDRCGQFGAYVFAENRLCLDCYELRGSCCQEFAEDDLRPRCTTRPARERTA
jgi:hypothetical protein